MRLAFRRNLLFLIAFFILLPIKLGFLVFTFRRPSMISKPIERLEVLDSEGNLLATSMQTYSIYCLPYEILDTHESIAKDLAPILGVKRKYIENRVSRRSKFVWIARHITPEKANKISNLGLSGIYIFKDSVRFYPLGDLFFHIVGRVNTDLNGVMGVEKCYDSYLKNKHNAPLKLSLKTSMQHILKDEICQAQKKYSAKSVSGMVVSAETGKILAVFSKGHGQEELNPHLKSSKYDFNVMFQGRFELGSVVKVLSSAMFLEYGIVGPDTNLIVPPFYMIGTHKIKDYGKKHLEAISLNFQEAFQFSSNVAFVSLANENLDLVAQKNFYSRLGIFEPVYIDKMFIGSSVYPKKMRRCDISVFSYGYGVSLSLAGYLSAFLRVVTGRQLSLHIEENFEPTRFESLLILSRSTVLNIRSLLYQNVVNYERLCAFQGIKVGGKTGTAKTHSKYGYKENSNLSSYVFVFPVDNPKFAGIIFIEEPTLNGAALFGSQSAMWVAFSVIERLIKLVY